MSARRSTLFLLTALAGCGHDDGPEQAMQTFSAFQQALQGRDEAGCRELLTRESRAAVAELPWEQISERDPLQVVGATRARSNAEEFHVDVVDPNVDGASGRYVVVREYGRLVVDLVASAGLTAQVVEASGSREEFVPTELTPADFDRIREYELSQAPGNPGGN